MNTALIIHDNAHATRILRRLAQLTITSSSPASWRSAPRLPPPPAGDPVARFLLSNYGMPGETR